MRLLALLVALALALPACAQDSEIPNGDPAQTSEPDGRAAYADQVRGYLSYDDPAIALVGGHVIDGADPDILHAAHAEHAKAVVSTMRRAADNARLLSALAGPKVLVCVFSEEEAEVAAGAMVRWCEQVMSANDVRDAPMH